MGFQGLAMLKPGAAIDGDCEGRSMTKHYNEANPGKLLGGKTGEQGRRHVDESIIQSAVKAAMQRAGPYMSGNCITFFGQTVGLIGA